MCIVTALNKLDTVIQRADEFIQANAPRLLSNQQHSKLVDLTTIALMGFEDHVFHWDQLRNIAIERIALFEHGKLPWYLDIDRSTDQVITLAHEQGQKIKLGVSQILLSALISVN